MEASILTILFELPGATLNYIRGASWLALFLHTVILITLYHVFRMLIILGWMFLTGRQNKHVVKEKVRFSESGPGSKVILIAGDSTAAGMGAANPRDTFAGMLARDFPKTDVYNVAANGALTRDILKQFERHPYIRPDVFVLSTGGNDLWSFITIRRIARDLSDVIRAAKARGNGNVIVLFFGNAGSAPLFPYLIRKLLLRREQKAFRAFIDVCAQEKVELVELFTRKDGNPFVEHPDRYFSPDGLHPSGFGYVLWYERLLQSIHEKNYLPH